MNERAKQPGIKLRRATTADRPRLISLVNSAFAVEKFLDGTRIDDEKLSAAMQKGDILLAESAEGHLLGSVYMERRGSRGYLGMLAVDPPMQGRGLGRVLTETAEQQFRSEGIEAVDIIVLSLRTDLPPLYRKLGYVEIGREDFKPSRPLRPGMECHGVVMSKRL